MLDKRLQTCADFIEEGSVVCDVGTDHGYLAIDLIKSGKCTKVIASDINENPLESARKNVENAGLSDKIELVLSDGLENISLESVNCIIIAGMGGETIVKILENIDWNTKFGVSLVLQPMTKHEILRKFLCKIGFNYITEKYVEDGDKIYAIISARKISGYIQHLTEFESLGGVYDDDDCDEMTMKYRRKKAAQMEKIAESMRNAEKIDDSVHYSALSRKMLDGVKAEKVQDIYDFLNEKYPFSLQEKWDNSGFLVGGGDNMDVSKIVLALDITNEVVGEASSKRADLIISHHPVIFNPLKKIDRKNPVFKMIENDIAGICMHTNLDIAEGGTNSVIVRKIGEKCKVGTDSEYLEDFGNGSGLGYIIGLEKPLCAEEFGRILKEIFGCRYVRMNKSSEGEISRIAVCSGSGGSLLHTAIAKKCDALVTGDVKHDVWIDANNNNFAVFDCGHFHTENLVLWELRRVLEEKFPLLDIEIAESSVDPCMYV